MIRGSIDFGSLKKTNNNFKDNLESLGPFKTIDNRQLKRSSLIDTAFMPPVLKTEVSTEKKLTHCELIDVISPSPRSPQQKLKLK